MKPTVTTTEDRHVFLQADRWQRRVSSGGANSADPYDPTICCFCGRPVRSDAVRLRTARTNDGEWWLVSAKADLTTDEWRDFQTQAAGGRGPTILPIGPDCLRKHPEFEIGRVL